MARLGLLSALLVTLLVTACDDGKDATPTPTEAREPATATATAPAEPGGTATPTAAQPSTYPAQGRDELFVYTVGTGADATTNRLFPRRSVIVQDLATGRVLTKLEYSGKLGDNEVYPVGVQLAGRHIVVATEAAVTRYDLDGSNPTKLFEPPAPQQVADLAASPDGTMVAITSNCYLQCRPDNALTFYEVATGRLAKQVRQSSAGLDAFTGDFWQLSWSGDSSGVWVVGATYSEGGGGRAFVSVAGDVRSYLPGDWGFTAFSPLGRYLAEGVPQIGCMRVGGPALRVMDMDTGVVQANITGEQGVYAAWEWSPRGDELAFQFIPGDGSTCTLDESAREYRLYSIASGKVTGGQSMEALHQRWYGEHLVETVCEEARPDEPVLSRYGYSAVCKEPRPGDAIGDVFVGGAKVASWPEVGPGGLSLGFEPVGFLPK